jgi:hypothetical protein
MYIHKEIEIETLANLLNMKSLFNFHRELNMVIHTPHFVFYYILS